MGKINENDAKILSDDKDTELHIFSGGNGDWYVCVTPKGEGYIGRCVRIRTSGGISVTAPGVGIAAADMYRAIKKAEEAGTLDGNGFAE